MEDLVVAVDDADREIGSLPKLAAHQSGALHRAVSVFLFNRHGELLVQRRHGGKYHSGGMWSNSCCSHPRPGESVLDAATRRVREELGIDAQLRPIFRTSYCATVANGLIENEIVHAFAGHTDFAPNPNPSEVEAVSWVSLDALIERVRAAPDDFTAWFHIFLATKIDVIRAASCRVFEDDTDVL